MKDYLDSVKRDLIIVYPNMSDTPLIKKRWFHRHKEVTIYNRCAGDVNLCLRCGRITVERWSNNEVSLVGYVNPKTDGVYSGLLGAVPRFL